MWRCPPQDVHAPLVDLQRHNAVHVVLTQRDALPGVLRLWAEPKAWEGTILVLVSALHLLKPHSGKTVLNAYAYSVVTDKPVQFTQANK